MATEPLHALNRLIGTWAITATHPALSGVVIEGTAVAEWLEGDRFLIHRIHLDHPDFPDSVSIIGYTDRDRVDDDSGVVLEGSQLRMHYFDSRGVFRIYDTAVDDEAWLLWRPAPGFSQRFTGTFVDSGNTLSGRWQVSHDDVHWDDDLEITYLRRT